jgi:hypothetical protein
MAMCGLVAGKVLLDKHELRGFGDEMVRFEQPQDKWCDDYLAGTPPPAPEPRRYDARRDVLPVER